MIAFTLSSSCSFFFSPSSPLVFPPSRFPTYRIGPHFHAQALLLPNDVWMMILFGALGFVLRKWAYEAAPLLLALVLGPKLEVAFRQSLMISHGSFDIFVNRPISLAFLAATLLFLVIPLMKPFFARPAGRVDNQAE